MGSSSSAKPGDVLDRYRLVARLGHGGFGDVWRAEELLPDGAPFREVALKLLTSGGVDVVDWAEEAKLLASFRHPSLVTIYAAGILERAASASQQRFVAMELLEGVNLSDLLRARGPLPWRRVLAWAASAAAALDLIHAAGVVHLDLKPANLFLCKDGALKVLDFGIARRSGVAAPVVRRGADAKPGTTAPSDAELATELFVAERAERSHAEDAFAATRPVGSSGGGNSSGRQVVVGTPGFIAPEVLELAEPTAAADAYALAVCVVQLATGHLPYEAADEPPSWDDPTAVSAWLDELRRATLRGELRTFDEGPTRLPRGVAALMRRLLAVDPAHRGVVPGRLGALFEEVWERPHGVPDPPYFARSAYPPEAEGLLFGRDDDITRLGRELEYEPAIVLHGAAGSGKSSLITAGIVPYLAKRGVDGKDDWIAVRVERSTDPDEALANALAGVATKLVDAGSEEIAAWCETSPVGIALVIDPIDDLGPGPRARLDALAAAIAAGATRPGLRLVGALGEDGTTALLATPLGASLRLALRFVGPPATAAVRDIVAAPAHFAGVTVLGADKVAADVRRELRAGLGRLPYVALALEEWWRARAARAPVSERGKSVPPPSAPVLTGDRWVETGGVGGAVVRHAERVIAALSGAERVIAEEILLRLSATDGTPLRWDEDELVLAAAARDPDAGEPAARRVLEALARERLVRAEGRDVEIGHEALLKGWPRLASARLAEMERLVVLERLREARVAWERADNHKDFLLHGALLEEVTARGARIGRGIGPKERAFVRESTRQARIRKAMRGLVSGLAILAIAGGFVGKRMADDAREEEARAKAAKEEAEQLAELAARSRRTEDWYRRAALAAAAMARGSKDGLLPLDLYQSTKNLARAEFLTLEHLEAPAFPWDDRYLMGTLAGGALAILDFRPPEPDVIEDLDLDVDPDQAEQVHFKRPAMARLRPHETPLAERVPFAFDTAFATRAADGEVKVFRLRDDGRPALAAIAPVRCTGGLEAAAAAPVLACATERGVARWDLRRARKDPAAAVDLHAFPGEVLDISPDGERVAAVSGHDVLIWAPGEGRADVHETPRPVSMVRLAPREHVAALVAAPDVLIVDEHRRGGDGVAAPLFSIDLGEMRPDRARWEDGGRDLGVCDARGGRWYYLRRGGRAKGDAPPKGDPCAAPRPKGQPEPIAAEDDYRDLAERDFGPHVPLGGFRMRRHRYLTRGMVLLDANFGRPANAPPNASTPPAAARLLRFAGHDEWAGDEPPRPEDSIVAVERDETLIMFQIGDEMRFFSLPDGARLLTRKASFLRRCADGRWLGWRADGDVYRVFDAFIGTAMGDVPREPGFVVGADGACRALIHQRLDGTIVEHPFGGGSPRPIAKADGYVFDVRSSPARGGIPSGLWMSLSSGAIARFDDATRSIRVYGYATPRATAIADGPQPWEVVYADASGVFLLRPGAQPEWLRDGAGNVEWGDLSVSPDGTSLLLAAGDRLAALDLVRRELVGSVEGEGKERFLRWDDDGSLLLWSFDRHGGPEAVVIPRGVPLAKAVARAVSNLEVDEGRLTLRR
jgi:serine/threonine protein kinase